jgi:hypothetical protein
MLQEAIRRHCQIWKQSTNQRDRPSVRSTWPASIPSSGGHADDPYRCGIYSVAASGSLCVCRGVEPEATVRPDRVVDAG